MAYIRKRPTGKWQATVYLPDGSRTSRTHPLKSAVTSWATDLERNIAMGIDPNAPADTTPPTTFKEWSAQWMIRRVVEPETMRGDRSIMNKHISPFFDSYELLAIRPSVVDSWLAQLVADEVGPGARKRSYNLLRACLQAAVRDELIPANPAAPVTSPPESRGRVKWFTREQVSALLDRLDRRETQVSDEVADMARLMVWCGLRWGEVAGLRVMDIDWLRRRLYVCQVVTQSGRVKAYPKNSASHREVPVPPWLVDRLSRWGKGRETDALLFPNTRGNPLNAANWRRTYNEALTEAGLPRWPPHTLRHTSASWLVQSGVSLYEVQRFLGHSSPTMTAKYAHLAPGELSAIEAAQAGNAPVTPDQLAQ